ncbi:ferritin family protein [Actinoplanes sp. NPDC049118]|uniref:ferritin family protein n=1 Tax=Actinoplanes sp. NPDC049118 TaxID=3155769 RepID=UPI0033D2B799
MRARSALGVGLAVAVVVWAPAAGYAAGDSHDLGGISSTTRADAVAAMHGEAYAYAVYRAYAAEAADAGLEAVAKLFRDTARQERYEHFAELARLTDLVGSDVDNLTDAIAGERYEATVMYPAFARQARRDGCTAAAELFTEISGDEKRHAQWFAAARDALMNPDADQRFPVGDRVPAGPIPAGLPRCTGQTLANLDRAVHGEAFASLKYALYAGHARLAGQPRLARLFTAAGSQERNEHFAEEAALAGLVRSTEANLRTAVAGEREEATITYPAYRDRAARHGDTGAARLFDELAHDEARHASRFDDQYGSSRGRHAR